MGGMLSTCRIQFPYIFSHAGAQNAPQNGTLGGGGQGNPEAANDGEFGAADREGDEKVALHRQMAFHSRKGSIGSKPQRAMTMKF